MHAAIEQTPQELLHNIIQRAGLVFICEFVPWNKSRNADEKSPSLNWKVTAKAKNAPGYSFEYSKGCAHCRMYNGQVTIAVVEECNGAFGIVPFKNKAPDASCLLGSMLMDANCGSDTFEDFAANCGYDVDSRKAYTMWQQCRETDYFLRRALGGDYDAAQSAAADILGAPKEIRADRVHYNQTDQGVSHAHQTTLPLDRRRTAFRRRIARP